MAKWHSQDGRVTEIADMDDSHLANSIRFCETCFAEKKSAVAGLFTLFHQALEDTALGCWLDGVLHQEIAEFFPGYDGLCVEAAKRFVKATAVGYKPKTP